MYSPVFPPPRFPTPMLPRPIAAAEAMYEQMWAADVAAMVGYHGGASAAAAQLSSWSIGLQQALP
ncbi:hypothetical protein B6F22_17085, partial [Mycobacterium tuberculosis variant bovis]